jgi:glycosyltransferase involved in cell wall biosynthesis
VRIVFSSGTATWGGLEQMTVLIAHGLNVRGHEVALFSRKRSPVYEHLKDEMPCEQILHGSRLHPETLLRSALGIRKHRAEIIIGNSPKDPAWTGFAGRLMGVPYVHRHEFTSGFVHQSHRVEGRLFFDYVPSAYVVCSEASRVELIEYHHWLEPERIRVIPNGIDLSRFDGAPAADLGLPDDAVVFGFVGRYEEKKGITELGLAWPSVVEAVPNAHLVFVGWGHLEEPVREQLGATPNVHWLGFRKDIPELMNAFDVLVAPFHIEGFGLVLVEAMAAGKPVVAARATSLPEIIRDGVDGRLVTKEDPVSIAEGMIELGRDASLRARMGASGHARAYEKYSWTTMVEEHERLLDDVLNGRAPSNGR